MNFQHLLNGYMKLFNCSAKELAQASNLSEATISRYCNGFRSPINPSIQLDKLIKGLTKLAKQQPINDLNEKILLQEITTVIKYYDFEKITNNFNQLISTLKINIVDFAKVLGFDPSYLSKIRSNKRKPSDPEMFIEAISNYIVSNYNDDVNKKLVAQIINCPINKLVTNIDYKKEISYFLCSNYTVSTSTNEVSKFLTTLNNFDLNEYIRVIHFDELKVPTLPFKIPKSKHYYGIEEMKQGELDFFKATILSKSNKDVFMASDMQMDDMSKDLDFGKKWMLGIALMLKKGLHLNIIHNLDRPFQEMMIGLESWIPIYMTGQVRPYYLNNATSNTYSHLNYVSKDVALTGECIKNHHNKGKYYLTNNKTEVAYHQQKAALLLKKATPLMNIYLEQDHNSFNTFLNINSHKLGDRKYINSSLPIYTIEDDLLLKILKRHQISTQDIKKIIKFVKNEKIQMQTILQANSVFETTINISKEEFNNFPIYLELSHLFYIPKITYTYEEYIAHLKSTKSYSKKNKNYTLSLNKNVAFRNIQISIFVNQWVMISKINNPNVHFIIEHPKLCKAIENFITPIIE